MGECAERKMKNEGKGLSEGLRKGVYRRGGGAEPEKMDGGGGRPIKGAPNPGRKEGDLRDGSRPREGRRVGTVRLPKASGEVAMRPLCGEDPHP